MSVAGPAAVPTAIRDAYERALATQSKSVLLQSFGQQGQLGAGLNAGQLGYGLTLNCNSVAGAQSFNAASLGLS